MKLISLRAFSLITLSLLGVANVGACSSDDDAAPSADAGGDATTTTSSDSGAGADAKATTETKSIGAAGGTFTTASGVTLEFPAGAVAGDTTITVTKVSGAKPAVDGTSVVGDTYELGPAGATFAQPVKVTLPLPAGAPATNVVLLHLPTGGGEWLPIGGLDAGAKSVTGFTRSFSQFRLVQMLFAQAGCFVPTSCQLSCNASSCSGACRVEGTAIAAGVQCSPVDGRIGCLCDGSRVGLAAQRADVLYLDYATVFHPAVALYQVATRCGWPCSLPDGGTDAGHDASPPTDGGTFPDGGFTCSPPLVISKIYAAGGNSVGYPNYDFVELHNREATPLNVGGLALQVNDGNATGAWDVIPLTGTIPAGGFYLVQLGRDAVEVGTALPTPDAVGTYNLSGNGGRVAITVGTTPLTGAGPWSFLNGVAYASTTFALEGPAASFPAGNPGYMLQRGSSPLGCAATGNNNSDMIGFNYGAPKNSGGSPVACSCVAP